MRLSPQGSFLFFLDLQQPSTAGHLLRWPLSWVSEAPQPLFLHFLFVYPLLSMLTFSDLQLSAHFLDSGQNFCGWTCLFPQKEKCILHTISMLTLSKFAGSKQAIYISFHIFLSSIILNPALFQITLPPTACPAPYTNSSTTLYSNSSSLSWQQSPSWSLAPFTGSHHHL